MDESSGGSYLCGHASFVGTLSGIPGLLITVTADVRQLLDALGNR